MTDASARGESPTEASTGTARGLLAAFGATLLLSAFLLFAVQPLFAKLVLPLLGGAPAVWSIAMVFFQGALLIGYAYAHALIRFAGRFGIFVHAALMALALLWLPIAIASGFEAPPAGNLPLWVLTLFAVSLGVPILAVGANAPLLQAWFARTNHAHASDPYFLYGASNAGSLVALLSYPLLIEPQLTLKAQSYAWSVGYFGLAAAVVFCGAAAWKDRNGAAAKAPVASSANVSWRSRAEWAAYAFMPSALLVAVTAHLSTNIAAAPFLWVMPLAIFLLSFVVTFTRQPFLSARGMQLMLPIVLPAAMATVSFPGWLGGLPGIAINLFTLFVVAFVWNAELFGRRPAAARLTDFYLSMSAGGVLGGAFTSLVAPLVFSSVLEFPLLLGASILAIPEMRSLLFRRARSLTAIGGASLVVLVVALSPAIEHRERNFFGVVSTEITGDGRFRLLMHGTTVHGAEKLADLDGEDSTARRPEPLTYYAEGGPLAAGIEIAHRRKGALSVGVVGLGAGSLACYAEPLDRWRFFEINPAVIEIARDPRYFNFLASCAPDASILTGDARLTLRNEADGGFDALVIDAFSSDAIPVHLITGEALRLYVRKVRSDGVVLLHISNRFLELGSVVAATVRAEGLAGARMDHVRPDREYAESYKMSSEVVAVARNAEALAPFVAAGWQPLVSDGSVAPWTDDYSNIVGAMLRMQGLTPTPAISRVSSDLRK